MELVSRKLTQICKMSRTLYNALTSVQFAQIQRHELHDRRLFVLQGMVTVNLAHPDVMSASHILKPARLDMMDGG